jgi:hypothetical protein
MPRSSSSGPAREEGFPRALPVFEGYTVDERLGEFRKLSLGSMPEFVPFESTKGQGLLRRYRAKHRGP